MKDDGTNTAISTGHLASAQKHTLQDLLARACQHCKGPATKRKIQSVVAYQRHSRTFLVAAAWHQAAQQWQDV